MPCTPSPPVQCLCRVGVTARPGRLVTGLETNLLLCSAYYKLMLSQHWWKFACAGSSVSKSAPPSRARCKARAGLRETSLLVRGRVMSVTYLGEAGHHWASSCSCCGKNTTVDYTSCCMCWNKENVERCIFLCWLLAIRLSHDTIAQYNVHPWF
jgi:hypothetical protein